LKIFWTKEALLRLQEIEEYISKDNPIVAVEFIDKLISVAETIRIVPELSLENIRELLYKNYRIVYLVKRKSVNILTVFEGHQLLRKEEIFK